MNLRVSKHFLTEVKNVKEAMWNAWICNAIPNEVMADWAEENGFERPNLIRNFDNLDFNGKDRKEALLLFITLYKFCTNG